MIIAPSILSADFGKLAKSVALVKDAEWLHIDVMDGHFVPNISIGPLVVKGLRPYTKQILDTHLMISDANKYIPQFIEAGSDRITLENMVLKLEYLLNLELRLMLLQNGSHLLTRFL
jgi:ribulose-phosphate 3-epimerase